MNIAKRISLALALPVLIVTAIAIVSWWQVARVVSASEFMADNVAPSFAALSHFSRVINRVENVMMSEVLDDEAALHARRHADFDAAVAAGRTSLHQYLVADPEDGRLLAAVALAYGQWTEAAREAMATGARIDRAAAVRFLVGEVAARARRLDTALDAIVAYNEVLSRRARAAGEVAAAEAQHRQVAQVLVVLLLSIGLGLVVVKTIGGPIRELNAAVIAVASGDYERRVPFLTRTDETGALARSLETLRLAAAALTQQREVKAWVVGAIATLQGETDKAAFGERVLELLFSILPARSAQLFVTEEDGVTLRRVTSRGVSPWLSKCSPFASRGNPARGDPDRIVDPQS